MCIRDRVYIDWGQNGHGITIAAPYSLRPRPGAPASCPLLWSEVNDRLNPDDFNLKTLPERFEKMKDPLLPILGPGVDMGAALAAIRGKLESGKGEGDGGGAKKPAVRRKGRK